jgi:hypothetical protein
MDAIFIPIASMVGASLEQVKVYQNASAPELDLQSIFFSAHIMSSNIIPSRQSIHSHTIFSTRPETYIQPDGDISLPSSSPEHVLGIVAAAWECDGHLYNCSQCPRSQDALDCVCVGVIFKRSSTVFY